MLGHLFGQFYTSRLPATLRLRADVRIAHNTGEFPWAYCGAAGEPVVNRPRETASRLLVAQVYAKYRLTKMWNILAV